jgi:hypothetical protein
MYRIASRNNINGDKFDIWPAVLNSSFDEFDNKIESCTFRTENDIYEWLDAKRRTLDRTKQTKNQEICNGDPNRIYSVYMCNHTDTTHINSEPDMMDKFLYNLRLKKQSETPTIYQTEKGTKRNSTFTKILANMDFNNIDTEMMYSSQPIIINGEMYEGIYPIGSESTDQIDQIVQEYQNYVANVRDIDIAKSDNKIDMVLVDSPYGRRWLNDFLKKLNFVEIYLNFFAKGGDIFIKLNQDQSRHLMIKYIYDLLDRCRLDTPEDDLFQQSVRNMIDDPVLYQNPQFQIRCDKTLISWNKNYSHVLRSYGLIPSKTFADAIMNFNLMSFYRQRHDIQNLQSVIGNLEIIYNVNLSRSMQISLLTAPIRSKFKTISRSFE